MSRILARQKLPRNSVGSRSFTRHRKGSAKMLRVPGPGLALPPHQNRALYHLRVLCWRLLMPRVHPRLWKAGDGMVPAAGNLLISAGNLLCCRTGCSGTRGRACPLTSAQQGTSLRPRHVGLHSLCSACTPGAGGVTGAQAAPCPQGALQATRSLRGGSRCRSTHRQRGEADGGCETRD